MINLTAMDSCIIITMDFQEFGLITVMMRVSPVGIEDLVQHQEGKAVKNLIRVLRLAL